MPIAVTPVVLSGGSGTRLWPRSRSMYPKQLLALAGAETMLQSTLLRLRGLPVEVRQPIVVCNASHRFLVAEQLRAIGAEPRIILEPEGRNTAPAAFLAAHAEAQHGGDGSALLVLPADHVIQDHAALHASIALAVELIAERARTLVTFGIVPASPHTGYGYIKAGAAISGAAQAVDRFVEKPDAATAKRYVDSGDYFWNSGMFLFPVPALLDAGAQFAPEMVAATSAAMAAAVVDGDFICPDSDAFLKSPSDSIDYAIMEKSTSTAVLPLDAGWNDVGSWDALHDVHEKDANGNTLAGDVLAEDCREVFVSAGDRMVAAIGLTDCVIVDTADAVLVTSKQHAERTKAIVDRLKADDRPETRVHREIVEQWGTHECVASEGTVRVRRLRLKPGAALPPNDRPGSSRSFSVTTGRVRASRGSGDVDLAAGDCISAGAGENIELANPFDAAAGLIEVSRDEPGTAY